MHFAAGIINCLDRFARLLSVQAQGGNMFKWSENTGGGRETVLKQDISKTHELI